VLAGVIAVGNDSHYGRTITHAIRRTRSGTQAIGGGVTHRQDQQTEAAAKRKADVVRRATCWRSKELATALMMLAGTALAD
jgi:hypothetical protein